MRFEAFSFGSICIDGTTYGYDVVVDRGRIRKRKKKPSKRFRDKFGHTPLSIEEDTLEVPAACDRYGHWGLAGHGRGEARSESPQHRIGHTADNRSYQGAAGKSRRDQCDPARYMLEVDPGPELEKALDRCTCRLHRRRLHDAAGYSSRRDGSRKPGRDDSRYPVGQKLFGNVFRRGTKARPDQSCASATRQI